MVKNYGLIGCGMMGIEHINNLNLLAGARVSVVYDVVPELAEKLQKLQAAQMSCHPLRGCVHRQTLTQSSL